MPTYKFTIKGIIKDNSVIIPIERTQVDYQDYLQWVSAGGLTEPADVIVPVIPVVIVTPWQIRKALNATGLRKSVEAAVLAADANTKDAWEYATEFVRTDSLVVALGATLGKTPAELDSVFALAKSL